MLKIKFTKSWFWEILSMFFCFLLQQAIVCLQNRTNKPKFYPRLLKKLLGCDCVWGRETGINEWNGNGSMFS